MESKCSDFSPERNEIKNLFHHIRDQLQVLATSLHQEELDILKDLKQLANRFSSAAKMASAYHLSRLLRSYTNKCGEIYNAIQQLSTKRKGVLIIIQREDLVEPYITKGIHLDSMITSSLLDSIFHVGSPLHDGAVLIRNDTIDSAANILPLTKKTYKGKKMGTRHRAAIGLSEQTDALIFVVSEETGTQSFAYKGSLYRFEILKS